MYPWHDYGGRVSPLKLAVFLALFVPAGWVVLAYACGLLGARPLNEAIHQLGLWTIRLIFLALAVTPLRQILQWPRLLVVRRMIGVAAFAYVLMHFSLYVVSQAFDLGKVASEIALRIYLTIGFTALLSLAALAATALAEAVYFGLAFHAPVMRVLDADLSLETGLRPAVVVLAIGFAVAIAGALREATARSPKRRLHPA